MTLDPQGDFVRLVVERPHGVLTTLAVGRAVPVVLHPTGAQLLAVPTGRQPEPLPGSVEVLAGPSDDVIRVRGSAIVDERPASDIGVVLALRRGLGADASARWLARMGPLIRCVLIEPHTLELT